MSFSELSIKKLNQIIRAKAAQLPAEQSKSLLQRRAQVYEKDGLVALCSEHISPSEIDQLLDPIKTTPSSSSSSSSSSGSSGSGNSNSSGGGGGGVGADPAGMAQMANMTPEQLTRQVQAMRQNPSAFRSMQSPPLSDEQILQAGEWGGD
jgi:hypothetical protein